MALLDDIAAELEANLIAGGSTGWSLFKSYMPEDGSTNKAICIYETGGGYPDGNFTYPNFQIAGRGEVYGYEALRAKMKEVYDLLADGAVSGFAYIFATQEPLMIGYDKNDRPKIVINFEALMN